MTSSPHTRGSSLTTDDYAIADDVVPAHAGVIRAPMASRT